MRRFPFMVKIHSMVEQWHYFFSEWIFIHSARTLLCSNESRKAPQRFNNFWCVIFSLFACTWKWCIPLLTHYFWPYEGIEVILSPCIHYKSLAYNCNNFLRNANRTTICWDMAMSSSGTLGEKDIFLSENLHLINLLVNHWWSIDISDVPDLERWKVMG